MPICKSYQKKLYTTGTSFSFNSTLPTTPDDRPVYLATDNQLARKNNMEKLTCVIDAIEISFVHDSVCSHFSNILNEPKHNAIEPDKPEDSHVALQALCLDAIWCRCWPNNGENRRDSQGDDTTKE